MLWLPLVVLEPVQPLPAVQAVALVEDQVSVLALPDTIVVGLAVKVTVGAAGAVTVTVAVAVVLVPPTPVHTSEYDWLAVSAPVLNVPLVARLPVQLPLDVQPVAFVELQVSVDELPLVTEVGFAVKVTEGTGVVQLSPG